MNPKIKICGITNLTDAQLALDLGADLLGFNFYPPSPRYLEPAAAARIIAALPPQTVTVGIFVNETIDTVKTTLETCPLTMAQLHGDETDAYCQQIAALGPQIIKALRVRQPADIAGAHNYHVDAILLDAFHEKLFGGTGQTFDWSWIKTASLPKVFLAGGITPDNITDALAVAPYAIDLCGGVEKTPGLKDPHKMKLLFQRIAQYHA